MANDDFERKMEFIVEQQAQFAAKFGQLEDIVARLANATLTRFEVLEEKTAKRFENLDEKIAALVNSQIKTEEIVRATSQSVNNLTAVVDQYFRNRNGKSEG